MKQDDVAHLAALARISLTPEELTSLQADLESIVAYVGTVSEIAASGDGEPSVGARHDVFRADEVTNEPQAHTADLVAEMPHTDGNYLKVRKILKSE